MREEWRDVRNYEGHYQVSSAGKVRSLKRGGRLLALFVSDSGYVQLNLYRDGLVRHHYVHRLVAEAFIGVIPPMMEINHKDGCKQNNNVANLEIVTAKQNNEHARMMGLTPPAWGEKCRLSKLTANEVREIRKLKGALPGSRVATRFGVCVGTVYQIWSGRTWRHLG